VRVYKTLENLANIMNYNKASIVLIALILTITAYTLGYNHGVSYSAKHWRQRLISADYAEHDPRTGEWKLRAMDDVVTSGLILGKTGK
jgi:hypothetical protein